MSKIFKLIEDLELCYKIQTPYAEDYLKLSKNERKNLCGDVRKEVVNYVNSPEYCFLEITKTLYNTYSNNELYPYNSSRNIELDNKGFKDFGKL